MISMERILTTLLCFWLGLSPLFGQRLLVRQPIEGFRGSGEVLAYSSSRIFLQLNKDGEWPRQIQWVILDGSEPRCAITFNKVGWQYTSSTDSCSLDWMRLDLNSYRYRLFVVESVPSPSETLPDRVAESVLLIRTPSSPPPAPVVVKAQPETKDSTKAQGTFKSTTKPSQKDSTPEDSVRSVETPIPLTSNPRISRDTLESDPSVDITPYIVSSKRLAESAENAPLKDQETLSDAITQTAPPTILATAAADTTGVTPEKSVIDAPKSSQIATPLPPAETSPTDLVDSTTLSPASKVSPDTVEETPDYIFTVPDYQPRGRWFGRKKKSPTSAATNSPIQPLPRVSEGSDDSKTTSKTEVSDLGKPFIPSDTLVVVNKVENDTSVYEQKAPFISVASFETLEYTQEVLKQFTCPGGCIIVRSKKGLYYRIGFYPAPKNIAVDLREIRKKYSDAWLVN